MIQTKYDITLNKIADGKWLVSYSVDGTVLTQKRAFSKLRYALDFIEVNTKEEQK